MIENGHEDYLAQRVLDDGRGLYLMPLMFGGARLGVGPVDCGGLDDVWDYTDRAAARHACDAWDGQGEPEGWTRHPLTRRWRPDGTPASETIRE